MSRVSELSKAFEPLIQTCIDAGITAERDRIINIIKLRIYEIDSDSHMHAYAHRRRELKQLLRKI